jgi:pyridoxamine 5'-phosphate oxidase
VAAHDRDLSAIRDRRVQYETAGLGVSDLADDPIEQWLRWHAEAVDAGVVEPNAMSLATVDDQGMPDARYVLVRGADARGLAFYTNYNSAKSRHLDARPVAAGTFGWLDLHRQVRVKGIVERTSAADSDEYFASRPRASQIGAWASPQSDVIRDRSELDALVNEQSDRFEGAEVPRPEHWGGWRLVPDAVEFWQGRPSRLHDRLRYMSIDGYWRVSRLAP